MVIDYKTHCVICEDKIDFKKETFVRLTDFTGKKRTGECFYHLECWRNRFTITSEKIQRDANEWMNKISELAGGKRVIEMK